jgi:bifunctional UDP-N-acetylglucosamine pyrophosphorylase/glucosamine-1-phosphate N-acetyltransferase
VRIDVDVVLEGRVVLGDDVSIGPFCRLRTSSSARHARARALRP